MDEKNVIEKWLEYFKEPLIVGGLGWGRTCHLYVCEWKETMLRYKESYSSEKEVEDTKGSLWIDSSQGIDGITDDMI